MAEIIKIARSTKQAIVNRNLWDYVKSSCRPHWRISGEISHVYGWVFTIISELSKEFPAIWLVERFLIWRFIIHQIVLLVCDWSKLVTWPNPIAQFQNCARCEKDLKDSKDNSRHLALKCPRIFVLGHYLFLVAHSFPRANEEQIMSADKYPSIFSRQMATIVYLFIQNISPFLIG